jgi:hypothetical protein
VVDDITQIAIGISLASGYWTFPRWLGRVAPAIGVLLVVSGIVFLLQDW